MIDSLAPGGAERSLVDLAHHLPAFGVDLTIVTLHERGGYTDEVVAAGIEHHRLPRPGHHRVGDLTALIRQVRPDLVHTTLYDSDIAGRLAGALTRVPVVTTLANVRYGREQFAEPGLSATKLRAAQAIDIATSRAVRRFHAVSEPVADAMARALMVRRSHIEVVERGRDGRVLGVRTPERRSVTRRNLDIAADAPLLIVVARHEHQKGLDVLLDAVGRIRAGHPGLQVVVAGSTGRATPALEAQRKTLGLEDTVRFLGRRDDVSELLVAADVFVLPTRREGFPGSVVEAMALEIPIVASDISMVRAALPDERFGLLVPVDQPVAFASAITDVLADRSAAVRRAEAARSRFLDLFTIERSAERMADLFMTTARRRVAPHG